MSVPVFTALEKWTYEHTDIQNSRNHQGVSVTQKLAIFYGFQDEELRIETRKSAFSIQVKQFPSKPLQTPILLFDCVTYETLDAFTRGYKHAFNFMRLICQLLSKARTQELA